MAVWFLWTLANLPPLRGPNSEAATGSVLAALAILGTIVYAVSAVRYWRLFRHGPTLLSTAVIACFLLLSEAMIGVAVTGERKWHASWWEWHGLIVLAYLIIGFAARREWRDERFRDLYLPTTRERRQDDQRPLRRPRGLHELLRAVFAGRGRGDAQCVLGHGGAVAHPSVRRRGREVHRRRDRRHVQQPGRSARPRAPGCARGARPAACRGGSRRGASGLAAPAHRREQRRGGAFARSAETVTSRTRWSATRSTRLRAWRVSPRPAAC